MCSKYPKNEWLKTITVLFYMLAILPVGDPRSPCMWPFPVVSPYEVDRGSQKHRSGSASLRLRHDVTSTAVWGLKASHRPSPESRARDTRVSPPGGWSTRTAI